MACDNFLYGFKGAPSARRAWRPSPSLAIRRGNRGGVERPGDDRIEAAKVAGDLAVAGRQLRSRPSGR
jgi:hypothetical protein